MGQITNDAASVFSQKLVDELMARPEWRLKTPPKYVFLGVDPNGKLIIIIHFTKEKY